jgi:DNA (cytosine-5)-methyltransferase 1
MKSNKMVAYYNEFDPFAAAWLRELIKAGHIAPGEVDERSITEVRPDDLRGFTQCHFFAGIGGWSYALRIAGWPDDRPVWTGSCPCQPFSAAGRQKGKADDRHLWPVWENLIRKLRPTVCFGEQVSSAIAHGWLDDVYQGLEAEGYAVGAAVLPACSVGAPHKRDRLWFVGYAEHARPYGGQVTGSHNAAISNNAQGQNSTIKSTGAGEPSNVAHAHDTRPQGREFHAECAGQLSPWADGVEWLDCPDGKKRLVKSGLPLLAHGVSNRVGRLRGYGNAIVPAVGAAFIQSFLEVNE